MTPHLSAVTLGASVAVGHHRTLVAPADGAGIVLPLCEAVQVEGVIAQDGQNTADRFILGGEGADERVLGGGEGRGATVVHATDTKLQRASSLSPRITNVNELTSSPHTK